MTAIEGKQIPINNASKKQLRAFADHLGAVTSNFDTEAKLREKITAAGWDQGHILIEDAAAAKKPGKAPAADPKAMTEPMVELTIHTQEGPGGKRAVFVGVNGRAILIPRNKKCEVKLRYLRALEGAMETKYEYDEDLKANLPRDMPSYPFQVYRMPSEQEQEAWYAYEAAEEAKLNARATKLVPTMDARAAA